MVWCVKMEHLRSSKGRGGVEVNVEKSIAAIENYVSNDWDGQGGNIELTAEIVEPKGSEEELSKVKDLLGGFNTNYSSSTQNRCDNIATAARSMELFYIREKSFLFMRRSDR